MNQPLSLIALAAAMLAASVSGQGLPDGSAAAGREGPQTWHLEVAGEH